MIATLHFLSIALIDRREGFFGLPFNSPENGYLTATGQPRFEKHNVPLSVLVHMYCLSPDWQIFFYKAIVRKQTSSCVILAVGGRPKQK